MFAQRPNTTERSVVLAQQIASAAHVARISTHQHQKASAQAHAKGVTLPLFFAFDPAARLLISDHHVLDRELMLLETTDCPLGIFEHVVAANDALHGFISRNSRAGSSPRATL